LSSLRTSVIFIQNDRSVGIPNYEAGGTCQLPRSARSPQYKLLTLCGRDEETGTVFSEVGPHFPGKEESPINNQVSVATQRDTSSLVDFI